MYLFRHSVKCMHVFKLIFLGKSLVFKEHLTVKWYGCNVPAELKLNRGGNSRPFGNLVFASLSSAKKLWAQASTGESRLDGVYSSNLLQSNVASGGTRGRNTYTIQNIKYSKPKCIGFFYHVSYSSVLYTRGVPNKVFLEGLLSSSQQYQTQHWTAACCGRAPSSFLVTTYRYVDMVKKFEYSKHLKVR